MYGVLIVEDEMLVRLGIKSMLDWERLGLSVLDDVGNGKDAFDSYIRHKPDIIITDLKMPVMDGLTLIRKIRESDKDTIIIVLTCLDEFSLVQESIALGVSNYILKLTSTPEEIEKVLLNCRAELDELKNNYFENKWIDKNQIKAQIYDDFLFYESIPVNVFDSFVKHFGYLKSYSNLNLVIFRISNYDEAVQLRGDNCGRKFCNLVMEIIGKVVNKYVNGDIYCNYKLEYIVILSFPYAEIDRIKVVLDDILNGVKNALSNLVGVEVIYGASSVKNGVENLPELCHEAVGSLKNQAETLLPLKVRTVLTYIQNNYTKDISLTKLAELAGITPNYLSNLFMHTIGESVVDTINKIRIEHAKKLLFDTHKTVYMVSDQVGFSNCTYFIKVFKKFTGFTPNEFRNNINIIDMEKNTQYELR